MIFFGSVFEFLFFLYLANNFLMLNYPEQYSKVVVCASYNLIYYFSFAQIKFTKLLIIVNDKYFDFMKSNPQLLEYINKLKKTEHIEYVLDSVIQDKIPEKYDFIIYSDIINNSKTNKLILDKVPLIEEKNIICQETKYKFILSEITIGDKTTKIDFKTDNYNFMVVNNKINTAFIYYFMKKYYNYEGTSGFDYTIKILDQNVNEITLDKQKEIEFDLNAYRIIELNSELNNELNSEK
jgi:hypothetical protein